MKLTRRAVRPDCDVDQVETDLGRFTWPAARADEHRRAPQWLNTYKGIASR